MLSRTDPCDAFSELWGKLFRFTGFILKGGQVGNVEGSLWNAADVSARCNLDNPCPEGVPKCPVWVFLEAT